MQCFWVAFSAFFLCFRIDFIKITVLISHQTPLYSSSSKSRCRRSKSGRQRCGERRVRWPASAAGCERRADCCCRWASSSCPTRCRCREPATTAAAAKCCCPCCSRRLPRRCRGERSTTSSARSSQPVCCCGSSVPPDSPACTASGCPDWQRCRWSCSPGSRRQRLGRQSRQQRAAQSVYRCAQTIF